MRIGVRLALSGIVIGSIAVSTLAVHGLWWRTAKANSALLVETLNGQIVGAVKKELARLITDAEAAFGAVRTIFVQDVVRTQEADKREFVFLSQLQAQPSLSWVAFGWPDGAFFASHKLGDRNLEMMEVSVEDGKRQRRVDRYKFIPGDIEFERRHFEPSDYDSTQQPWYREGIGRDGAAWLEVSVHPARTRPAIAYAGPIDVYLKREGVLAVMIELDRLSRFLGGLQVGRMGAAFVLDPDGRAVAAPDPEADEINAARLQAQPLLAVAQHAQRAMLLRRDEQDGVARARIVENGAAHAVTVTPLGFRGWQVATVIPEAEFLGEIERTTQRLLIGLALLVLAAAGLSTWLARRLFAEPLRAVVGDLGHVERFELERIGRRPSSLTEFDALSSAMMRMAVGLSAFGKYLPADLVRTLVAEGVDAAPGGTMRPLTVLFADVAGFTGLSERLGERIVPLIGGYLDAVSRTIERKAGTIDKFLGDAVMAFWGAPRPSDSHALDACRAALACLQAVEAAGLTDDQGRPLRIRIGINSGVVLVGNIGSPTRLNYTAIGDAVNVASRLEGINKLYGTSIIVGEETRRLAGEAVVVREIDRIAVYGRARGIAIYELVALRTEDGALPLWIGVYESALRHYRARRWREAVGLFEKVSALRGGDGPAHLMAERCRALIAAPPAGDWEAVTVMDTK